MLRHTLLLIYRNATRFRSTFFINVIGLSSGLTCTLLIYLWVYDDLSVDKFHVNDSRLFQVRRNNETGNGIQTQVAMPIGLADALAREIPEVEHAATVTAMNWFPKFILSANDNHIKAEGRFVGKDFFKIFSYKLTEGKAGDVLSDKYSIVISEQLSKNLFGNSKNAVGKTIDWKISDWKYQCTVSGIVEDVPSNSSDQFDFVMSDDLLASIMGFSKSDLGGFGPSTYLTLKPGSNESAFNQKLTRFIQTKRLVNDRQSWFITPYSKNYLYGHFDNGIQTGGRIFYVKLFSLIALFILVIACINFINLSTAKASERIKEVGIKKVVGASRKSLIGQYVGESLLVSLVSMLIAVLVVDLLLGEFNEITGKHLVLAFTSDFCLSLCLLVLITGLLAGSYPAFYLSGFRPASILKGRMNTSAGELWIRKGLVIFQFTLSVIFIVSVSVIFGQLEFVQDKNLGYDKENILYFECDGTVARDPDAFTDKLSALPGVVRASSMISPLVQSFSQVGEMKINDHTIGMNQLRVNYGLLETLGIEMAEGRAFSKDFADTAKIIFNETAIGAMELKNPVGQTISFNGRQMEIIGVVKDFHFSSLYENIPPMVLGLETTQLWNIVVRIQAGKEEKALSNIEKFYKTYNPGFPFDYKFLDQQYQSLYAAEKRVATLSRYFAGLAILISCLGLFGLAAFTARRRTKEIGIRKVLGASERSIVHLLSGSFTRLVLVSIGIGLPVSYFTMKYWLDSFAYRIDLTPFYFISAGLLALVISWFTVAAQAIRAAKTNPVNCLRHE
jgi:putative ABC transport system permease protein